MQEFFATILLAIVFGGVALAAVYAWTLTRFFNELRAGEPEIWKEIGSPTLFNMLVMPFKDFRKYYAFLPVLRERGKSSSYKYAARALKLLYAGLALVSLMFATAILLGMTL